jgi:hypothetical protein
MSFKIAIKYMCALEFFVYFHFLFPLYSLNPHLYPYLQSDVIHYAENVQTEILCAFILSVWSSLKDASNGRIVTCCKL